MMHQTNKVKKILEKAKKKLKRKYAKNISGKNG
jgi:hypothetical protein